MGGLMSGGLFWYVVQPLRASCSRTKTPSRAGLSTKTSPSCGRIFAGEGSAEGAAAAFFVCGTAEGAWDGGEMAAVLEGVETKAANHAPGQRAPLCPPVPEARNTRE